MPVDDDLRSLLRDHPGRSRETGPVALADAYLRAVERIEALPENAPGTDKTWVRIVIDRAARFYARAVRVR